MYQKKKSFQLGILNFDFMFQIMCWREVKEHHLQVC